MSSQGWGNPSQLSPSCNGWSETFTTVTILYWLLQAFLCAKEISNSDFYLMTILAAPSQLRTNSYLTANNKKMHERLLISFKYTCNVKTAYTCSAPYISESHCSLVSPFPLQTCCPPTGHPSSVGTTVSSLLAPSFWMSTAIGSFWGGKTSCTLSCWVPSAANLKRWGFSTKQIIKNKNKHILCSFAKLM